MSDAVAFTLSVIGYPDRPGISRVYVGDLALFDGQDEPVTRLEVKVTVPFHVAFGTPILAAVWREAGK